MKRFALLLVLAVPVALASGCGDLENDRVCLSSPCQVPGRASEACISYVACYYRTGGTAGTLDSTYSHGGTCWTSGAQVASACTSACSSALSSLRSFDAGC